jgi:hypothetical protein
MAQKAELSLGAFSHKTMVSVLPAHAVDVLLIWRECPCPLIHFVHSCYLFLYEGASLIMVSFLSHRWDIQSDAKREALLVLQLVFFVGIVSPTGYQIFIPIREQETRIETFSPCFLFTQHEILHPQRPHQHRLLFCQPRRPEEIFDVTTGPFQRLQQNFASLLTP